MIPSGWEPAIVDGEAREALRTLPGESVHCVVASPPYCGLRDHGPRAVLWGGGPSCRHDRGVLPPRRGLSPLEAPSQRKSHWTQECAVRTSTAVSRSASAEFRATAAGARATHACSAMDRSAPILLPRSPERGVRSAARTDPVFPDVSSVRQRAQSFDGSIFLRLAQQSEAFRLSLGHPSTPRRLEEVRERESAGKPAEHLTPPGEREVLSRTLVRPSAPRGQGLSARSDPSSATSADRS